LQEERYKKKNTGSGELFIPERWIGSCRRGLVAEKKEKGAGQEFL
jgi:hypothetical protein